MIDFNQNRGERALDKRMWLTDDTCSRGNMWFWGFVIDERKSRIVEIRQSWSSTRCWIHRISRFLYEQWLHIVGRWIVPVNIHHLALTISDRGDMLVRCVPPFSEERMEIGS